MPSQNRLKLKLMGILSVLLLLGIVFWWQFSRDEGFSPEVNYLQTPGGEEEKSRVQLYFVAAGTGNSAVEQRFLPKLPSLESQAKLVLKELILGPKQGQLQATIPPETKLREFFLDEQGCAYLDFEAALKINHPGGSYAELLTITSLVNTLSANFPQIKRVKLLINGVETETLAGHIDTRFPFSPETLSLTPLT